METFKPSSSRPKVDMKRSKIAPAGGGLRWSPNITGNSVGFILLWCVLVTGVSGSTSSTWIAIEAQPTERFAAAEVFEPQPVVSLFTGGLTDVFGNVIPTTLISESIAPNTYVRSTLQKLAPADNNSVLLGEQNVRVICGRAVFTDLVVQRVGRYRLMLSSEFLSTAPTNLTREFEVVPGPAFALEMTRHPNGFRLQRAFQEQPLLEIRDRGGNVVIDSTLTVQVEILQPAQGVRIWSDKNELTAERGIANFERLTCTFCVENNTRGLALSTVASSLRLRFSASGVFSVDTAPFDVSLWPPNGIIVSRAPDIAYAGRPFAVQPIVYQIDTAGHLITWEPDPISQIEVRIRSRPGTIESLTGAAKADIKRGFSRFTDLQLDFVNADYSLEFVYLSATFVDISPQLSPLFNVIFGTASKLGMGNLFGAPSFSGTQPTGAVPGYPLRQQPVVIVQDVAGNWVRNATFDIAVELRQNGSLVLDRALDMTSTGFKSCPIVETTYQCQQCDSLTAGCGIFNFVGLRIDRAGVGFQLVFTSGLLEPATSLPFNIATGPPYQLGILQEPLGFRVDSASRVQPVVQLLDEGSNRVLTAQMSVFPTLCVDDRSQFSYLPENNSLCEIGNNITNLFMPTRSVPVQDGLANFTDLTISTIGLGFSLLFCSSSPAIRCVQSSLFNVTYTPIQIVVERQPSQAAAGLPLGQMPSVSISDMTGVPSPWAPGGFLMITSSVCLLDGDNETEVWFCELDAIRDNEDDLSCPPLPAPPDLLEGVLPDVNLQGTLSQPAVEGIAVFTDLQIDRAGVFKMLFRSGGLEVAESQRFVVEIGAASKLKVLRRNQGARPGFAFDVQPVVALQDLGGNLVVSDSETVVTAALLVDSETIEPIPVYIHKQPAAISVEKGLAWFQGLGVAMSGRTYQILYSTRLPSGQDASISSDAFFLMPGLPARLVLTNMPSRCSLLTAGVDVCQDQPVVSVGDQAGNIVTSAAANVRGSVWASPASQDPLIVFFSDTVRGVATFTNFSSPVAGRSLVLRFESSGLIPAEVFDFVVSATPSQLRLVDQRAPSGGEAGFPVFDQPVVAIEDASGGLVDADTFITVTASVTDFPSCPEPCTVGPDSNENADFLSGSSLVQQGNFVPVGGGKSVTAQRGFSNFSDLQVNVRAQCFVMVFSAGALEPTASQPFSIVSGVHRVIVVTRQPFGAIAGRELAVQPTVAIHDAGGNLRWEDSDTVVTASLLGRALSDLQGGTNKVVRMSQGQGGFQRLRIDVASPCLLLSFSAVGRSPGFSVSFEVLPLDPVKLAFLPGATPAGPAPGQAMTAQPALVVEDRYGNRGNPRAGDIWVDVVLLQGGERTDCEIAVVCLLGNSRATFERAGIAAFTDLRIDKMNTNSANYSLLFSAEGLTSIESDRDLVVRTSPVVVGLGIIVKPDGFAAGKRFLTTPVVGIIDAGGNVVVDSFATTVSLQLEGDGQEGSLLGGTSILLAENGVANFDDLSVNQTMSNLTLYFSAFAVGLGFVRTEVFDVADATASLRLLIQPVGGTGGELFSSQPVLEARDDGGRLITWIGDVGGLCSRCIVAELISDDNLLQGNRVSPYVRGTAIFTNFRIDIAGIYRLRFTADNNVSVVSMPVQITNRDPTTLVILQQPLPFEAGAKLAQQPIVRVIDAFGNFILDRSVSVTAQLYQAGGSSLPDAPAQMIGFNVVNSQSAVADFNMTGLGVIDAGSGFFFVFSSVETPSVSSDIFSVQTAAPFRMFFSQTPAHFYNGEVLAPFPTLYLEDKGGNTIASNSTVSVTLHNMSGCQNTSQNDTSFAFGSTERPCGEELDSLAITQPWCLAEQIRDDSDLYCRAILNANASEGSLPLIPQAGSWPLHPSQSGYVVQWKLGSAINITFAEFQQIQVATLVNENTTYETLNYSLFELTFNATLLTNGTEVFASCIGRANISKIVNVTNKVRGYTQHELRQQLDVNITEYFNFSDGNAFQTSFIDALQTSNSSNTSSTFFTQSLIVSHLCVKYNLTENLYTGEAVFRGLTVMLPGVARKLRFTLFNCPLILGSVEPTCANQSIASEAIVLETGTFEVSGFPAKLVTKSWPSEVGTGGSQFDTQPTFIVTDADGRLFTKKSGITISATLLATDGRSGCSLATPYRCPGTTAVCVVRASQCPQLAGSTEQPQNLGTVDFTDLAITTCNDFTIESFICLFGEYRLSFLAVGIIQFPNTTNVSLSLPVQVSPTIFIKLGPPAQLLISVQPDGGSARAGAVLNTQPELYMRDAGGNRVLDPGIIIRVFAVRNGTDVTASAIDGTLALPSFKGAVIFTDLALLVADVPIELTFSIDSGASDQASNPLQVLPGIAASITVDRHPSTAIGGEAFGTQPLLSVRDSWGNLAWMVEHNVSAQLAPWSMGQGGHLCPGVCPETKLEKAVIETVRGVATFTSLAIDVVASCYVILFTAPSLYSATSVPLNVEPGPPFQLIILQQPDGALPGYALSDQPAVGLCDRGGNQIPFNRDRVTASASLDGEPIPLVGRLLQRAVDGFVRFTDLTLLRAENGTVLTFTRFVGGMNSAQSQPLSVPSGAPHSLRVVREAESPTVGSALGVQPVVRIEDAGGNLVVNGGEILVTAQLLQGGIPSPLPIHGPSCTSIDCVLPCYPPLPCPIAAMRCPSCLPKELRRFTLPTNGSDANYRRIEEAVNPDGVMVLKAVGGIANFSMLSLESVGEDFHIRFTSFPLRWVDSDPRLTVSAGTPWKLGFVRRPAGFQVETRFREQPVLHVQDVGGNRIYVNGGTMVATLWGAGESGDANGTMLLPTRNLVVTIMSGEAKFVNLRVDRPGSGLAILFTSTICYSLHSERERAPDVTSFSSSNSSPTNSTGAQEPDLIGSTFSSLSQWYQTSAGCLPAYTGHFTVTETPTKMAVDRSPRTSLILQPLIGQPIIHIQDNRGRLVDYESGRRVVRVSLVADASREQAVLGGMRKVVCCSGICPFTDLSIDRGQAGYRLLFSSPPFLDVYSELFDVVGPSRLAMLRQPWGGLAGRPFSLQPRVIITDEWGAKIAVNVSVTASLQGGSERKGTRLMGNAVVNGTDGEARFTDLYVDGVGSRFLLHFASDTLLGTMSEEFEVDGTVRPNACSAAGQTCTVGK